MKIVKKYFLSKLCLVEMKRIACIILILLILSPVSAAASRHVRIEEAEETDLPLYHFFSSLLDLSTTSAEKIVEREETIDELNSLKRILDISVEEIAEYKARGISTPAEENISEFISLGRALRDIYEGQNLFLKSFGTLQKEKSYESYLNALRGVEIGKRGIKEAELSVSKIKALEFRGSGGEILKLSTEDIERALERLERIFENYERLLQPYELSERFIVIHASEENPHLFEEVEIYGYTSESEVTLHVLTPSHEKNFPVEIEEGRFNLSLSFDELGAHQIFATSGALKSNVLILNVSRIPTIIIAEGGSSRISEEFVLRGHLLDYRGDPLRGREIISGEMRALTDENGSFDFRLKSEKRARISLELLFPGDEIYESSRTTAEVIFYGENLRITLEAPEEPLRSGEIELRGYVDSGYDIPLEIYVDERHIKTIYASSSFTFNLSLDAGEHTVFALFRGDELYEPAKSNILEIRIYGQHERIPEILSIPLHAQKRENYFLFALILLAILSAKLILSRRKAERAERSEGEKMRADAVEGRRAERISGSFRDLYLMLLKSYGLGRSMTPRELLRALRDVRFREELRRAVRLHERSFYGMEKLKSHEERMLGRAIRKVIMLLRRGS